jgi:hypothetical protein
MYRINNQIKDSLYYSIELGKLVHELQLERGTTALFLSADVTYEHLVAQYNKTNLKIKILTKWQPLQEPDYFQSRDSFIDHIRKFRSYNFTLNQALQFYSDIIAIFETLMTESMDYEHPFTSWGDFTAYKLLIFSKEQAGIERALGSAYYARGISKKTTTTTTKKPTKKTTFGARHGNNVLEKFTSFILMTPSC